MRYNQDVAGRKKLEGEQRPGWGGYRPGSGSSPLYEERLKKTSVALRPSDISLCEDWGNGSVGAGIRRLIDEIRRLGIAKPAP